MPSLERFLHYYHRRRRIQTIQLLQILAIIEEDENEDIELIQNLLSTRNHVARQPRCTSDRINFTAHVEQLQQNHQFDSSYQMTLESFNLLLSWLRPLLVVDELQSRRASSGIASISPEIMLHCTLLYLAGESYDNIQRVAQISKPSFYRVVWRTVHAINEIPQLQIKLPSTTNAELQQVKDGFSQLSMQNMMDGCVGALGGWLCTIYEPSLRSVPNSSDYYSDKYQVYGMNVQAMCDSVGRFLYFKVTDLTNASDWTASSSLTIANWIDNLPDNHFVVAENAYLRSEKLVVTSLDQQCVDDENGDLHLQQTHMCNTIANAFNLLSDKWGILKKPLKCSFVNIPPLVHACAKLHNFCIHKQPSSL
jgi:hypothetical protein